MIYFKKTDFFYRLSLIVLGAFVVFFNILLFSCSENSFENVIIGKNGWLFEGKNPEKNIDTIADYKGENLFTEDELRQIKTALEEKAAFYEEYNAELKLMLIPNAMTIYQENLPDSIKSKKAEQSRLQQVEEYIRQNSQIDVINLTDDLRTAKEADERPLYDNTGTTWNSYGAFIGYQALMENLKQNYEKEMYVKKLEDFDITEEQSSGLLLALETDNPEKYTNTSVTLKQKLMVLGQNVNSYSDKISMTYISDEDIMLRFVWSNIMILGDEYIDNLKQFVSESFKNAAYIKNYNNHRSLIMQIKPDTVIFGFAEKNLSTLLNLGGTVALDETKTSSPVLVGKTFLADDRYCIAGKGEEGSVISIQGGENSVTTKVKDGQFIAEVFVGTQRNQDITLYVFASKEGKEESEPLIVTIDRKEKRQEKSVFAGKENHLHYHETIPDFLGNALYKESELKTIKTKFEKLQQQLVDAGLKTKIILFIAPNHGTIYPETMPDFIIEQKVSDNSRLFQLMEYMKDSSVKFITPYDRLMEAKKTGLVYNLTDTHWNELGAYQGYYDIFEYISLEFPSATPKPLESLEIVRAEVNGGDIIPMLGFDQNQFKEWTTNVRVKPEEQSTIVFKTDEILYQDSWFHQAREYDRGESDKPNILMYRDSFSISMLSLIAETANRTTFHSMWDYNINVEYIKKVNPDYVIIERVERSIGELPYMLR